MAKTDKLDNWLSMSDVVSQTGLSQRTVYRMVTEGRLTQGQRRIPGRRPLSVFDPSEVAEIVASTSNPRSIRHQGAHPDETTPAAQGPDSGTSGAPLPPSELSFKLYLTEEEAIRYTGFGRAHLRAYGKGRMIGPHGTRVYRRVDLEKL